MDTALKTQTTNRVVSKEEWLEARKVLLEKEKELTKMYDGVRELRAQLPWLKVEKEYIFDGENGKESLSDLFQGRSQLIVQHFMFAPEWEEGCVGCSFQADHVDGARMHLEPHNVSFVAISRAPYKVIEAFKKRMGWKFKWVSSYENDFNFDYNVSFTEEQVNFGKGTYNFREQSIDMPELPGTSAFYKDESGQLFHTYSCYERGLELAVTTYVYLDIAPKGRNETGPDFSLTDWVRHHDKYNEPVEKSGGCCCE